MTHSPTPSPDAVRQLTVGTMISEFSGPGMPRVLQKIGFTFGIVDTEHGTFGFDDLAVMAGVTAQSDFSLLVRVPAIAKEHIGRVLDLGADGIVVPMVSTVAEAAEAVRLAKYAPLGERGVSVTRAHSGYGVDDLPSYLMSTNERTQVFVQMETQEAIANAAEIAAVPGVYGLFMGPNDFLQSIGVPGQLDHPELDQAMQAVAAAAEQAGVVSGVISSKAGLLTRGAELGMTVLSYDSELGHLIKGASSALATLKKDLGTA